MNRVAVPLVSLLRRWWVLFLLLSYGFSVDGYAADRVAEQRHVEAVAQARAGNYVSALATLEDLHRRHPESENYRDDFITVLSWSGADRRALDETRGVDVKRLPIYVLDAVAKSARNLRELSVAASCYREIVARDSGNYDGVIGLVQVLRDDGRSDESWAAAQTLIERWPTRSDALMEFAHVAEAYSQWVAALDAYQRLLAVEPKHRDALRGRVFTLMHMGAPDVALSYVVAEPTLFTPQEQDELRHEQAIVLLRWSHLARADNGERQRELDAAVARLRGLLRDIEARGDGATERARQVRFDLVVALSEQEADSEASALFRRIDAPGAVVPDYARSAAAASEARLGNVARAEALYRQILAQRPNDPDAVEGLIYVYFDMQRFDEAERLARSWAKREPARLPVPGRKLTQENWRKLRADRLAVKAAAYDDQLDRAQTRLEPLVANAPRHAGLRNDLGNIYLWRGWPRLAQAQFQIALANDAHDIDAQRGAIAALLDQGSYSEARARWSAAEPALAVAKGVGASIDRRARAMAEFSIATNDNSVRERATNELATDARFASAMSREGWRATAHYRDSAADLAGGRARLQRAAGGFSRATPEWDAAGDVSADVHDGSNAGVGARAVWHPDDFWRLGLGGETYMQDLPLQAYVRDIDANRVFADVGYRVSESRSAGLHAEAVSFSDTNHRTAFSAYASQRVWASARSKLDVGMDAYTSSNTFDGAAYFNPKSDRSFNGTVALDQRLLRTGETTWSHRIAASIGNYWQEDYDAHQTWALRYQHSWQPVERFRLSVAVKRGKPVYDGRDEFNTEWTCSGVVEFGP